MSHLEIKPSLRSYHLAALAVDEELQTEKSNPSIKQAWINLGNQLEIEGIPKEKISTIASQLLIEKKSEKTGIPKEELRNSGWFHTVFHSQGWIDPFYSHPNEDDAYERRGNSSLNSKVANIRVIDFLNRTRKICKTAITKFEEADNLILHIEPKILHNLVNEWEAILDIAEDAFNEKTKIPQNIQHVALLKAATESSVTYAARIIFRVRLSLMDETGKFISSKQLGHIQDGDLPDQLIMYEPDSRDMSIFLRYSGLQCIHCDSWMTRKKHISNPNGLNMDCIKCEKSFKGITISKCRYCQMPLYKEELEHILKTWEAVDEDKFQGDQMSGGRCPNCDSINHLPMELIEYAKS